MERNNKIEEASAAIRRLWEKHGIKKPFRFLGFCLSLLPIPVIQQAGQALDRHLGDEERSAELERIWNDLINSNQRIDELQNLEDAIIEIAKTVNAHESLLEMSRKYAASLGERYSEFAIDTSDGSYQELINSFIEATNVTISAKQQSSNLVKDSKIESQRTHLHASGNSENKIHNSSFTDGSGEVFARGVSTRGDSRFEGSSMELSGRSEIMVGGQGQRGDIIIGPNVQEVKLNCPACKKELTMDRRKLASDNANICPHCKSSF